MQTVVISPSFEAWRKSARSLLARGVPPEAVLWCDDPREAPLFGAREEATAADAVPRVTPAFLDLARTAAAHAAPQRWSVLYQILWRLTRGGQKHLLQMGTDPDVYQARQWCKAVGRDIHKMHAFVRFRQTGVDPATGREQFVAWFEPEHRIVRLAAPFFERRFASMDWSILTPSECAHWDGASLVFTEGVNRSAVPDEDALEELWRTYYRSIFNPARVKVKAMQSEMPKKYWKNLPEAPLIAGLISGSQTRVEKMLATEERPPKPAPKNAYLASLARRNAAERVEELPLQETQKNPDPGNT